MRGEVSWWRTSLQKRGPSFQKFRIIRVWPGFRLGICANGGQHYLQRTARGGNFKGQYSHQTRMIGGRALCCPPLRPLRKGDGALPTLIAAQRFLAASAMAFLPAALNVRLRFAGATVRGPGGRPRRFGPSRASMARFSLSRSANSNARICSLDIGQLIIAEISARRSSSSSNCTKTNEGAD